RRVGRQAVGLRHPQPILPRSEPQSRTVPEGALRRLACTLRWRRRASDRRHSRRSRQARLPPRHLDDRRAQHRLATLLRPSRHAPRKEGLLRDGRLNRAITMKDKIVVRRAVEADCPQLAKLLSSLQAHYSSPDPPGGAVRMAKLLTRA